LDFELQGTEDGDDFTIMDSCGGTFLSAAVRRPPGSAGITWDRVSLKGGTYQICWCSYQTSCVLADDFLISVGKLTLCGPEMNHVHSCSAGIPCTIIGVQGYYLSSADSLLIADTCGTPSHFHTPALLEEGSHYEWRALFGNSKSVGGLYRLCWCGGVEETHTSWHDDMMQNTQIASKCRSLADYIDIGELHFAGPRDTIDRTCITGQSCTIRAIHGYDLTPQDTIGIFHEKCTSGQIISRFPLTGYTQTHLSILHSYDITNIITAAGGSYRICWCSHQSSCLPSSFLTDIGTLTLLGPMPLTQYMGMT
jgi:hypothetical protein